MKPLLFLLILPCTLLAQSYPEYLDDLPQVESIAPTDLVPVSVGSGPQLSTRNVRAENLLESLKGFSNWPASGSGTLTNGMGSIGKSYIGPNGWEFWSIEQDGTQRKMGGMDFSGNLSFDAFIGEHRGTFSGNGSGLTNLSASAFPAGLVTNSPPMTGLMAWYSASALTGSNGQWMTNVPDLSGNNNTATSPVPPRLQNAVAGGRKALRFRGATIASGQENNSIVLPSSIVVKNTNGYSVFIVSRQACQASGCYIKFGTADGYTGNLQYRFENPQYYRPYVVSDGNPSQTSGYLPASVCFHGFSVQTNGTAAGRFGVTTYIDGDVVGNSAGVELTANGQFSGGHIGRNGVGGYELTADIFEVFIYNHAITGIELSQLQKWVDLNYPTTRGSRGLIACVGDSIVGGGGSGQNGNYVDITFPSQLGEKMAGYRPMNFGYSGQILDSISALFSNSCQVVGFPFAEKWVLIQGGVNDLIRGTNGANTYTNFVKLAKQAKATGAKVAAMTDIASSGGSEATTFNTQIKSYLASEAGVDLIIDAAADWRFSTAYGKAIHMQADGVHPTQAGAGALAEIVAAAISRSTNNPMAFNGNVSISGTLTATAGTLYPQQASAPTAAEIGGTVGSVTNYLDRNVNGKRMTYWSDGATVWSKQLAP